MKIIKIITISFCIILMMSQTLFALDSIISKAEDWDVVGENKLQYTMDTSILDQASRKIYNILFTVATVIAIVVGAILGIQYMTAGINKKVEVKESFYPYIISCIVVFGSMGIWKLVVEIMGQIK